MIQLITPPSYGEFSGTLIEMYRMRYRVFKLRMAWDVQTSDDMEMDDFDALHPFYLTQVSENGRVQGSVRLLPSLGPTMLRDTFPVLLEDHPAPSTPLIWESSRFAIDVAADAPKGDHGITRAAYELFAGMVEFGLSRQLTDIVTVTDVRMERIPLARDIALAIRAKIKDVTGLNASAGISYNKFLAKLASDHRKPNGQYVITPEMGPAFVETLPVGKFHGIGPATSAKMNALGLYTGLDMRNQSLEFMQTNFGKAGSYYYWISRGVDNREVRADRIRKSIGAENTFSSDLTEFEAMMSELLPLIDKVWRHCDDKDTRGRTVTLKVKFADFELITRSRTVASAVDSRSELEGVSTELLKALFPMKKSVRLLGVSISGFIGENVVPPQIPLF